MQWTFDSAVLLRGRCPHFLSRVNYHDSLHPGSIDLWWYRMDSDAHRQHQQGTGLDFTNLLNLVRSALLGIRQKHPHFKQPRFVVSPEALAHRISRAILFVFMCSPALLLHDTRYSSCSKYRGQPQYR